MATMFMAAGLVMVLMLIAHGAFFFPSPVNFGILSISNSCHSLQKNLLLDLRGCGYQLSVLNPFSGNQLAGNLVHFVAPSPDDDNLQTIVLVQMNVQAGIHGYMRLMLHV